MGQTVTVPDYCVPLLQDAVGNNFLLPDTSIDPLLLKYSFPNSDMVLQQDFKEKLADQNRLDQLPVYVKSVGSALGPFTKIPNAVGLGAFILSFILESFMPKEKQDTGNMLQHVFTDEKSHAIRVSMDNYMQRTAVHIGYAAAWHLEEARKTAEVLSKELTSLRLVMMDGQMTSRYLKQWVNGAAFHVLLRAHMANIKHTDCGMDCSREPRSAAHNLVNLYLAKLPALLDKYKQYKISTIRLVHYAPSIICSFMDTERAEREREVRFNCKHVMSHRDMFKPGTYYDLCPSNRNNLDAYRNEYVERMFSSPTITELTKYFTDLSSNLDRLMTRSGEFHASCAEVRQTYQNVQCN